MRRGQWAIRVSAGTRLSATEAQFNRRAWLSVYEGENEVFCREWNELIERELLWAVTCLPPALFLPVSLFLCLFPGIMERAVCAGETLLDMIPGRC